MFNQFLADVTTVEGEEMAAKTAEKLEQGKTPFMALYEARRDIHAKTLAASQDMLSAKFDSTRE